MENDWLPIEEAPKDGTRVLLYRPEALDWGRIVVGSFNEDKYAKRPRPYWGTDLERIEGTRPTRQIQPTHFQYLKPPVKESAEDE